MSTQEVKEVMGETLEKKNIKDLLDSYGVAFNYA